MHRALRNPHQILQSCKREVTHAGTAGPGHLLSAVMVLWWVLNINEGEDVGRLTAFTASDVTSGENRVNFCPYISSFMGI